MAKIVDREMDEIRLNLLRTIAYSLKDSKMIPSNKLEPRVTLEVLHRPCVFQKATELARSDRQVLCVVKPHHSYYFRCQVQNINQLL